MKNFTTAFKTKANLKTLTREDMLAYCALRALACKNEDKQMLFNYFVGRAFTPGTRKTPAYGAIREAARGLRVSSRWRPFTHVLGLPVDSVFDTEEELETFKSLIKPLEDTLFERKEFAHA